MTYIKEFDREKYEKALTELTAILAVLNNEKLGGELNYVVTRLCKGSLSKVNHYTRLNAVIGALECSKIELYRRVIAPYEDSKIKENGDVE